MSEKLLKEGRKKPFTTGEYFETIVKRLKEKGKLPEILDYTVPSGNKCCQIRSDDFVITNRLDFGGSEGIYLDVGIRLYGGEETAYSLGTFKTLDESADAMHVMAGLLADFILENRNYLWSNPDDFEWTGYGISFFDADGNLLRPGFCTGSAVSKKQAVEKAGKELERREKAVKAVVRDNATRKEEEIVKNAQSIRECQARKFLASFFAKNLVKKISYFPMLEESSASFPLGNGYCIGCKAIPKRCFAITLLDCSGSVKNQVNSVCTDGLNPKKIEDGVRRLLALPDVWELVKSGANWDMIYLVASIDNMRSWPSR